MPATPAARLLARALAQARRRRDLRLAVGVVALVALVVALKLVVM
ncbi:MAG TPA: hypothetical protein VI318_07060 [Baekduia sp.]|jgi:hypothetical protein